MIVSILLLGFVIGMRHAIEADHVAAVASLTTRNKFSGSNALATAIKQGAVWGLGHTLTLFIVGAVVLLMENVIPERLAQSLELVVGMMLVFLGVDVLHRLWKQRIHFHLHKHNDGISHFHAHSHQQEAQHNPQKHVHQHPTGFPFRALFIGLMHGLAGSAALILLTLQTVQSPLLGMIYILLFGAGSIVGMAVLSVVIAVPLHYSADGLTWLHNGLQGVVGCATLLLGMMVVYHIGFVEGLLVS